MSLIEGLIYFGAVLLMALLLTWTGLAAYPSKPAPLPVDASRECWRMDELAAAIEAARMPPKAPANGGRNGAQPAR